MPGRSGRNYLGRGYGRGHDRLGRRLSACPAAHRAHGTTSIYFWGATLFLRRGALVLISLRPHIVPSSATGVAPHARRPASYRLSQQGPAQRADRHQPRVGEGVEEILKADLALEHDAVPLLKEAIAHCEAVRDFVSREIFERILESEEEHIDFLERQFDMIERMGLPNYCQLQSKPAED
ncbi:MAG: ferritin-like domain-containing protein [Novosphingobium sp.]